MMTRTIQMYFDLFLIRFWSTNVVTRYHWSYGASLGPEMTKTGN